MDRLIWDYGKSPVDKRHITQIVRYMRQDEADALGYSQRKGFRISKQGCSRIRI